MQILNEYVNVSVLLGRPQISSLVSKKRGGDEFHWPAWTIVLLRQNSTRDFLPDTNQKQEGTQPE